MTWLILTFLSHLVFIPGLYDGFSLPKRVYAFGLGIAAIVYLISQHRKLPLFGLILSYLGFSLIPLFWLANLPLFIERFGLDVACFAVFWAVAISDLDKEKIKTVLAFASVVAALVLAAEHFLPVTHGTMGNQKYTAFVAAQAAPLMLALLPGIAPILAVWTLTILSLPSRAAFSAAGISLFIFGVCRRVRWIGLAFCLAMIVAMTFPAFVKGFNLDVDRRAVWLNSASMLGSTRTLFFGIGRGQFDVEYPAYANRIETDDGTGEYMVTLSDVNITKGLGAGFVGAASRTQSHPHNEFINSFIESGLFAGVVFWWVLLSLIDGIWFSKDSATLAIICSLIVTVLFSTFWFPFTHPSMAITFWALAGLLWNHSSRSGVI